jgi:hypothetical protein
LKNNRKRNRTPVTPVIPKKETPAPKKKLNPISFRPYSPALMARIDALAEKHGIPRNETMNHMLEFAVAQAEAEDAAEKSGNRK